ncbi:MAG: Hemolysin-type calcium-binding repeat-containing protein, partial [Nocardioides sp.]|nr:Hemolysin-type calcium-binding repeat-containing protein [Nocardioides sp.]
MRPHVLVTLAAGLAGGLVSLPAATQAAPSGATYTCHGVRATIVGTGKPDRIVGTPGRDVIVARGGGDRIDARGGRDLVCAGAGEDVVEGGPGNDRLYGEGDGASHVDGLTLLGDRLDGGPGSDRLDPGRDPRPLDHDLGHAEEVRFRHGGGVRVDLVAGRATGQGHDRIVVGQVLDVVGSDGDDVLLGTDRGEVFSGRGGDDRVESAGGRDFVVEGDAPNGDDTYLLGD